MQEVSREGAGRRHLGGTWSGGGGGGGSSSHRGGGTKARQEGAHLNLMPCLQNLEMHDRLEHLIEKQISHGNFSTQTWAKTEHLGG